jgi:TonB family protein
LRQLWQLVQLKKHSFSAEVHPGYTLVYTNQQQPAFTFGRTIFLSHSGNFSPAEKEIILAHEQVHVKQKHTLDMLFLEAIIIFQWFNPVVWLLKSSLRDQHEFLADQAGVKAAPDLHFYTRQIIGQVLNVSPFALTHNFSSSQLKKRIIMMQQKTTLHRLITRAALALPVAGILFYTIACETAQQEVAPAQTEQPVTSADAKKDAEQSNVMPSFKGNETALFTYLAENIKVPEISKAQEGKVFAEFVVAANGKVTDVKILKVLGEPFDSEVVRVLTNMPAWNPARKQGQPVSMQMVVPVAFKSNASNTRKKTAFRYNSFENTLGGC